MEGDRVWFGDCLTCIVRCIAAADVVCVEAAQERDDGAASTTVWVWRDAVKPATASVAMVHECRDIRSVEDLQV
jgi:hypothetical protein